MTSQFRDTTSLVSETPSTRRFTDESFQASLSPRDIEGNDYICDKKNECAVKSATKTYPRATIDIPLKTGIQATMVFMIVTLSYWLHKACKFKYFGECTANNPWISTLMGVPPLNKLFSILLTVYSVTRLAESRAYYNRLSTFVDPYVNSFLFFCALCTIISGPCVGYWDTYYDNLTHCEMAGIWC